MLPRVPADFTRSRDGLHALAFYVLSAARRAATGRIGLQWTPGGFGTTPFDGTTIRVDGLDLVVGSDAGARRSPITTLAAAGELVGLVPNPADKGRFDVLDMPPSDERLGISAGAVALLDAWFGLGTTVLDELRAAAPEREAPAPTLWPEHFDLAIELGDESRGERATFGVSPGDAEHPEPYAYVSAWREVNRADPYWNDRAFQGASVAYVDLASAGEPAVRLRAFFDEGLAAISRRD